MSAGKPPLRPGSSAPVSGQYRERGRGGAGREITCINDRPCVLLRSRAVRTKSLTTTQGTGVAGSDVVSIKETASVKNLAFYPVVSAQTGSRISLV